MPVFRLPSEIAFPRPELAERSGLVAVGGDLSQERLLAAYRSGIFPWYSEGEPILWFSPDPRFVLYPGELRLSKSLRRALNSGKYEIRADTRLRAVIEACADAPRPGQKGTWITRDMIEAYVRLGESGYAHSFEAYRAGELAGGLYGLSLGKAFFGESMFHWRPDASKVALAALCAFCERRGFAFVDAQAPTPHLAKMGARAIPRAQFLQELGRALRGETQRGLWTTLASAIPSAARDG